MKFKHISVLPLISLIFLFLSFHHGAELTSSNAHARWDIIVPDDYATLQEAIDHAKPGYRILIKEGIYKENLVIDKPFILLCGKNKERTIIDGGKTTKDTIRVKADGITLRNLTIRNGWSENERLWDLAGIRIESSNVVVKNCIIKQNRLGINALTGCYNLTIENNTFIGDGILLANYVYSCKLDKKDFLHKIRNNTVNGKPLCYLANSRDLIVTGDVGQIILANCTNVTIEGISLRGTDFPIILGYCSNCIIRNVTVMDNDGEIILLHSRGCILENNEASGELHGICLDFLSEDNVVRYNVVHDNWVGISVLSGSSYNLICFNEVYNNAEGIAISSYCQHLGATKNILRDNWISRNNIGIIVGSGSNDNSIEKNFISSNRVGIIVKSSSDNLIMENIFVRNILSACFLNCSKNVWFKNYWNRPRLLPKLIPGCRRLGYLVVPWINVDPSPLKSVPYELRINLYKLPERPVISFFNFWREAASWQFVHAEMIPYAFTAFPLLVTRLISARTSRLVLFQITRFHCHAPPIA
ncbi:MAG TPA: hypothetical protein ENF43_02495 [Thermoplasmatales archaeon]|nr:hypothetical protein [Thermoplasmatales archaeon]